MSDTGFLGDDNVYVFDRKNKWLWKPPKYIIFCKCPSTLLLSKTEIFCYKKNETSLMSEIFLTKYTTMHVPFGVPFLFCTVESLEIAWWGHLNSTRKALNDSYNFWRL